MSLSASVALVMAAMSTATTRRFLLYGESVLVYDEFDISDSLG